MNVCYTVEAKSRNDLRVFSNMLRRKLRLENEIKIPIIELLDIFCEVFESFSYEIVPDDELPCDIHAETDVLSCHIKIKESVYDGACDGNGRDRMTIAHEIGHALMLCCYGFKLQLHRNFSGGEIKPYNDPEWQAKCFAGEFMVNYELTKNMTPEQIAISCGISLEAARYQYNHR